MHQGGQLMTPSAVSTNWPEIWGVFAPADHLRRRPFVVDVVIYDKLLVPVPPKDLDDPLREKWERQWDSARQAELLNIIDAARRGSVIRVEWSEMQDQRWRSWPARQLLAEDASADVTNIAAAGIDPDSWGQYQERRYLVATRGGQDIDEEIRRAIPDSSVQLVAAYGSRREFSRAIPTQPAEEGMRDKTLLSAFSWPLLVPASVERSDADLLREAAELASLPDAHNYRQAFHAWRAAAITSGIAPSQAKADLEDAIRKYGESVRKTKVVTKVRIAVLVTIAGLGGLAGAAMGGLGPALAIPIVAQGLGMLAERRIVTALPPELMSGALFHEARTTFDSHRFHW
jgi:hypothetical protein